MARFNYLNVNPDLEDIGDCVVRAITLANPYLEYEDVEEKLYYTSQLLECPERCVCCYSFLLDNVFDYEQVDCYGLSVHEFCQEYDEGVYLVRMDGHLTCVINGEIWDTWDCGNEIVTNAWNVSRETI